MILRWRTEPTLKIDDVRSKTQSPAHPLRKLFLPEYTQKSPNNLQIAVRLTVFSVYQIHR